MGTTLSAPQMVPSLLNEHYFYIYQRVQEHPFLFRSFSDQEVKTACYYTASQLGNHFIPVRQLSLADGVNVDQVLRVFCLIKQHKLYQ